MYTIEDLSNKKVALVNDGTLEELREVLSLAYPKDKHIASGDCQYYYTLDFNINEYNGTNEKLIIPTQSVKEFIKQIRDKDTKTNLEEMENKQEYELVDFKIEDLKEGSILENSLEILEVQGVVGKVVISTTKEGYVRQHTIKTLQNSGIKLQITKPKLEKIQGFEVRKYPELPLVEVSDDEYFPSFNVSIVQLKEVLEGNSTPFFDGNSVWGFCRPVPKEKRNFIEIEKD